MQMRGLGWTRRDLIEIALWFVGTIAVLVLIGAVLAILVETGVR